MGQQTNHAKYDVVRKAICEARRTSNPQAVYACGVTGFLFYEEAVLFESSECKTHMLTVNRKGKITYAQK